jgi:hypothetical protein
MIESHLNEVWQDTVPAVWRPGGQQAALEWRRHLRRGKAFALADNVFLKSQAGRDAVLQCGHVAIGRPISAIFNAANCAVRKNSAPGANRSAARL